MTNSHSLKVLTLVCFMSFGNLVGCVSEVDPNEVIARVNDTNIKRLTNLYLAYQMKHNWMGPKDEQEFKQFLANFNPEKLTRIGIEPSNIDGLFVSERDGEPLKVRYGVKGNMMGCSKPVIFEATGVDGTRMVGFLNMVSREVEPSEYEQLWAGKLDDTDPSRNETLSQ